ncbi:hypothetical protein A7P95_01090 [Eikenella longinqua]|uniref:Uncharacterized protein n=1 Tax=Eikenella longinqua TaxID=1795827 RepID=A0A1A9S244_9NEIS|nr:hypothetical protein [Eikenella longinqua]OAM31126.1 hypothetical protein A7P95_01090 [Eikenella longinqua]
MPTIMKAWLKTILLPHLCSLLLLELFVLPHAVPLLWSGKAALPEALSALFSPLLLWLLGGTLAWRGVFAFPNMPPEYTVAVLLIIAAALFALPETAHRHRQAAGVVCTVVVVCLRFVGAGCAGLRK